jgi:hypothetical protein
MKNEKNLKNKNQLVKSVLLYILSLNFDKYQQHLLIIIIFLQIF